MGYVFRYNSTTSGRTPKRTTPSDSAHRIGPSTLSKDVLTVEEGVYGWRFKNCKIGHSFRHISTIRVHTAKRPTPSDSVHQIGLTTLLTDVLTVDEGVSGWGLKMAESERFCRRFEKQCPYGEMEGGVGFSASNRCIYPLQAYSNCR